MVSVATKGNTWLTLDEAAKLVGRHMNTVSNNRKYFRWKRDGHGSRAPILIERKSLIRWARGYHRPIPINAG